MENNQNTVDGLQQVLTDSIQKMANLSLGNMKPFIDGMMNNLTAINKTVIATGIPIIKIPTIKMKDCNCCPPENVCPPHCMASISKCAMAGERILVPFKIKNTCSISKTYRIGVRELKSDDGQMAPAQPLLDKQSVTLDPGRSEKVLMTIDLEKFNNGSVYTTEIVVRENEINQNICFILSLDGDCNTVVAEPQDEKKYRLRWQNWQSHYYCEPQKDRVATN